MKNLLLLIIKSYWFLIPPSKRNKCIFEESCSNYVFKTTENEGFFKGFKALIERFNSCRPGYNIIDIDNITYVITTNNKMYALSEMRNDLIK